MSIFYITQLFALIVVLSVISHLGIGSCPLIHQPKPIILHDFNSGENRKLARVLSSFNSLKHFVIEFTGDYGMGNYNDNTCEVADQIIDSLSNHPNLEKDLCLMFKFVRGMAPILFDSPQSSLAGKRKLQQMR